MRLISSLAAAAAALADQAADRLDTWVENTTDTEAPRETPLGFTPATGTDAPDPEAIINAAADRGLAGEQRDRWLAEVKGRLDVSTGGPWCTEERDKPTGRIMSPYGVIATGVTREADRDLIEDARADLFGLLALAEHDDKVIKAWEAAAASHAARRAEAERDLQLMEHHLRAVDMVAAAWVDGSLKGYRYSVDPGEPAGRVRAAIEGITASRGKTIRDLQAQIQAMTRADGELGGMHEREAAVERVLDSLVDGRLKLDEYVDPETPAGRVAELVTTLLTQIRDAENGAQVQHLTDDLTAARETIADLERKLERHHRHDAEAETDSPFMPGPQASQHAHTIRVALDMYDKGTDPLASLTLRHPLDLSGRVAALASHALRLQADNAEAETDSHLEVAAVMGAYDRGLDLADIDVREDSLAERVLGALIVERGRTADIEGKLDRYHRYDAEAATDVDAVRAAAAAAARIREAADHVERIAKEHDVDPRSRNAFLAGMYESARIAEADDPADGVIITAEGEPRFTFPEAPANLDTAYYGADLYDDGDTEDALSNSNGDRILTYGGGSDGGNPPAHIVVTSAGYVRDVVEADDDRHVGAQVKHPDPLTDIEGGTDE